MTGVHSVDLRRCSWAVVLVAAICAAGGDVWGQGVVAQLASDAAAASTWLPEQQKLTASDGGAFERFGQIQVGLSGDTALVGAKGDRVFQSQPGAAYVYTRAGASWTEQKLLPNDPVPKAAFGWSVAIDGDTAVIGAQYHKPDALYGARGAAYVFTRTGDTWTQQQLLALNDFTLKNVGRRVAVSGDTLLIGAYKRDQYENRPYGRVFVFTRTGAVWTQQAELVPSDGAPGDDFGSLALEGDTAVVGSGNHEHGPGPLNNLGGRMCSRERAACGPSSRS